MINEENLVTELKRKNEKALEFVIKQYGGLIKSIIETTLHNFKDTGIIEECMDDVLIAIWENSYKFLESGSFKSWIAAIAKFKAIDYGRRNAKFLFHEDIDKADITIGCEASLKLINDEINKELEDLLKKLKEEDKEIFIRKYFNDEKSKDIANDIGRDEKFINNRLSRGRKKLKTMLLGGAK